MQQTKDEIAADNAKADAEKRRQEELIKENHCTMVQMDIDKDTNRAQTVTRTIRTFADIEGDSKEVFVGYEDISSGEDSDSGLAKDTLTLKVRFQAEII
jgi:hypothetical protein